MTINYSTATRTARAQAIADAIDGGTGPNATLSIYTGARPVTPGGAITDQVLIVALPFAVPCAQSVSGGILTFSPLAETMAPGTVAPVWARAADRDGNFVADLDVGLVDSGADIELPLDTVYQGTLIRVTSATILEP
jgi:hypothetical protein